MDFETMIRAAVQEGKSLEDIASEVGATLNKVQEEARTKKTAKQECLDKWSEIFHEHYDAGHLDLSDVSALAVLVCQGSYPDWTLADLEQFRDSVRNSITSLAEMQGKEIGEVITGLFNDIFGTKGKREEKKPCRGCKGDTDPVREFLKTL